MSIDVSSLYHWYEAISQPINQSTRTRKRGTPKPVAMQPSSALGPASAGKIQPWHQKHELPSTLQVLCQILIYRTLLCMTRQRLPSPDFGHVTMQELRATAEYYRPPASYCVLDQGKRPRNRVEPCVGREEKKFACFPSKWWTCPIQSGNVKVNIPPWTPTTNPPIPYPATTTKEGPEQRQETNPAPPTPNNNAAVCQIQIQMTTSRCEIQGSLSYTLHTVYINRI